MQSLATKSWRTVLNETADIIIGVLSVLSLNHNIQAINRVEAYRYFHELEQTMTDLFPVPLDWTQTGIYWYSETLGNSLEIAQTWGIGCTTNGREFEVTHMRASRNLELLRERTEEETLERFATAAQKLDEILKISIA